MDGNGTRFFVVGTGRCGSTFLSRILRASEEVLSLSEVFTALGGRKAFAKPVLSGSELWELFSRPQPDMMALLRSGPAVPEVLVDRARWVKDGETPAVPPLLMIPLPHLSDEPDRIFAELREEVIAYPTRTVPQQLEQTFEWLRIRMKRRTWVERSGGSNGYLELLTAGFPAAKFIHLVRDGRDCALSMSRHPYFRLRMARYLAKNDDLHPDLCLNDEIPLDRFGAFWSALMIHADRALAKLDPERVLVLRYEALTTDPAAELQRLARFMECESMAGTAETAASWMRSSASSWKDLPPPVRGLLERACKPGMRILERQTGR